MKTRCVRLSAPAFLEHFEALEDPRQVSKIDHLLVDILVIALLAVICGAETWSEIAEFGERKRRLLERLLPLPNGIPSKHTFQRVFARLKPAPFEASFRRWTNHLIGTTDGKLIAVDGKTLRGSGRAYPMGRAMHLVHAWSVNNRVLLGQYATDAKSNEITAIPELLKLLDLKGAVVTIDAMGCQKKIVAKIVQKEADYAIALKGNQETLHEEVAGYLDAAIADGGARTFETRDEAHGRTEIRRVYAVSDVDWLSSYDEWPGLRSLVCVERERTVKGKQTSIERVHYITSIPAHHVRRLARIIRSHWGVENALHWSLDVSFREDASRIRSESGPENFALLRRIALVLMKRETSVRGGAPTKQFRAAVDPTYAMRVLLAGIPAESQPAR